MTERSHASKVDIAGLRFMPGTGSDGPGSIPEAAATNTNTPTKADGNRLCCAQHRLKTDNDGPTSAQLVALPAKGNGEQNLIAKETLRIGSNRRNLYQNVFTQKAFRSESNRRGH